MEHLLAVKSAVIAEICYEIWTCWFNSVIRPEKHCSFILFSWSLAKFSIRNTVGLSRTQYGLTKMSNPWL